MKYKRWTSLCQFLGGCAAVYGWLTLGELICRALGVG